MRAKFSWKMSLLVRSEIIGLLLFEDMFLFSYSVLPLSLTIQGKGTLIGMRLLSKGNPKTT